MKEDLRSREELEKEALELMLFINGQKFKVKQAKKELDIVLMRIDDLKKEEEE